MRIIRFCQKFLTHGTQHHGEAFDPLPWQKDDLLLPLFGWEMQDDQGRWIRRFRKAYIEIPKKNGKTTLSAAIGLYMLMCDGWFDGFGKFHPEMEAESYTVATAYPQAAKPLRTAAQMIKRSPFLSARLRITRGQADTTANIAYDQTGSFWRVLTASADANQGQDANFLICDELHAWGRDFSIYDAVQSATTARPQGLLFQITTAGDDPTSVCWEQHEYAQKVLRGEEVNDRFFPLIYAMGKNDDPFDEETWKKANPSLGYTIPIGNFRDEAAIAQQQKGGKALTRFKRYHLNDWPIGGLDAWLDKDDWKACLAKYTAEELKGPCWAGLDLSKSRDSTSLQLVFRHGDKFRLLSYFWMPKESAIERRAEVDWFPWEKQGFVTLVDGRVIEYPDLVQTIQELAIRYQIKTLAYDPWNALPVIQQLKGIDCLEFGQGLKYMAAPTADFERLVLQGGIEHCGNACMDWQVSNARVRPDVNNNMKPLKPDQGDVRKIDGVIAAIMALAVAQQAPPRESAYLRPQGQRTLYI